MLDDDGPSLIVQRHYSHLERITADNIFPIKPRREMPGIKKISKYWMWLYNLFAHIDELPVKQTPGTQNSNTSS